MARKQLDWRDYGNSRAAYRADARQVAKDGTRAKQALELARSLQPAKPELLADSFRAFSGRLEWRGTSHDSALLYCTGQYFPTEYRKAAAAVLETYIAAWRQWYASEHPQEYTYADMDDVRAANEQIGNHWFDRSTMKFFKTRIESRLIAGKRFITSERGPHDMRKRFTIREAQPDGSIDTIGNFQQFATLAQAKANVLMNPSQVSK